MLDQPNTSTDESMTPTPVPSDVSKWMTDTDEGQELMRRARESGNWKQYLDDYWRWRNEGESHEQALQGWRGAPRRVVRDVTQIPSELEKIRRQPFFAFQEHYDQRLQDAGVTGEAGAVGLIAWDIIWGTIAGTAEGIYDISRGQFDLEQVVHVASVVTPMARVALVRGMASQLAKKTVVGAGTKYYVPRKIWEDVLNDLSPQDINRLQKAGIWDGRFQKVETGAEVASLTLEAEEWVHELVGIGAMRGVAETSASLYRKVRAVQASNEPVPDAEPEEAEVEGEAEAETEAAPETETETEATPEGDEVETEVEAEAEVEAETEPDPAMMRSAEFEALVTDIAADPTLVGMIPNSDAEAELIETAIREHPDFLSLPETQLYSGALPEIVAQAVRERLVEIRAGQEIESEPGAATGTEGAPDAEQQGTEGLGSGEQIQPDVETIPEGETGGETEEVEQTTGSPDETTPEGESETTPEGGETEGETEEQLGAPSQEYEALVKQISEMPQAQDPETLQATIEGFRPVLQTLPEWSPMGREQKALIAKLFLDVQARVGESTAPEGETEGEGQPAKPTSPVEGTPYRTVYSSDRKDSFRTRYGIMELSDVVPSHQLDGSEDPRYKHPDLQPREERGGIPSLNQVKEQAAKLRTNFLLDPFATTSDGAPIISFKHPPLVVSGNGRVMTLQKALRDHPDQWAIYQRDLRTAVEQYGIDASELEGMTNPVLVQFLDEEVNEVIFADDANRQAGLGYSATETASRDARYLTDAIMVQWQMTGDAFETALQSPENEDFRKALLEAIPDNDHPRFLTKEGTSFSSDGINRLRNMMMRYVFRGDYGAELSRLLIESEFDSIKNIQNMLNVAIPHLALIESYTRHGLRAKNLSIAEDVARAVGVLAELSKNGESVHNFVHQDLLFQPQTTLENLSLTGIEVLALMDEKQRAYQQLASVFMRYTQAVLDEPLPGESLVETGFSPESFFENEIRDHFKNNTPPDIQKWKEAEESGDPPRQVPDWEVHERVEGYVENYLDRIKDQAAARAIEKPTPGFEGEAVEIPEGEPRPEGIERTGVVPPEVSPEGIAPPEGGTPEIEVPGVEGAEPEVTPDGVELPTPPEPKQPPPILPKNPTLKLVDITPKGTDQNAESLRTYVMEERPDVEIQISNTGDGYYVTALVPGYVGHAVYAAKQGAVFNDAEAKRAILDALASEEFRNIDWQLRPDDPMTNQGIPDPSEAEQMRIDKMPHLKQSKKFKDFFTNTNRGISFEMPGLDPAMRLKTTFERFGRYTVYIESDAFSEALRGYELGEGAHTFIAGESNQPAALVLRGVEGFDPMDALKRGLARVLDDSVWDGNNEPVEPDVPSIEGGGVPGNQPPPFPVQVELRNPVILSGMNQVEFSIGDGSGNIVKGYRVHVNQDPFGLDDGTMEVTMEFPGFDLEPLSEFVTAKWPEDAAMGAITAWRQFELGKGGIAPPANATTEMTSIEDGESLLEENLPPVIKSSERPFGQLELDTDAMDFEGLKHNGVLRIFKFNTAHAPRVRLRKLGTTKEPEWHVELSYPRRNSANHISYKKRWLDAIQDAIDTIEASDHEWKPLYKSGVFSELDKVLNAVNRRQFATTPAVERRLRGLFTNLRRGVEVDLRGYKLTSLKELALLGQVFRNPKFEAFTVAYLNENHEIVGHDRIAFGVPAMTGTVTNARIGYQMKRLGARYFMDMHNHPGGVTVFSEEDKRSSRINADIFEDKYLGSVVINHGEYSETRNIENVDKQGKKTYRLQHRERIRLTESELGWNPRHDPKPPSKTDMKKTHNQSWSPLHSVVRPSDPLYQYDIDTPNGKLVEMSRQIGKERDVSYALKQEAFQNRRNVARLGKYLQLEQNWTTLFFTNYAHEVMAVMDYKDLHRLTPTQLWNFINTEARKHGGVYVSAYVGEGDWYDTLDDVRKSPWGALMDDSSENQRGIEHYWFAGLTDAAEMDHKALFQTSGRQMFDEHEDLSIIEKGKSAYKVPGYQGGVIESQTDSDFGIDTKLTEPSVERDRLVQEIYSILDQIGTFSLDLEDAYTDAFGSISNELRQRFTLLQSFGRFVTNQHQLGLHHNISEYGPSEARDMYDATFGLENDLNIVFKTQGQRATAYALSRLANITDKDTVLTLNDKDGMLATYAEMHAAGKVMTTVSDGFIRKMFDQFMPGVTELHTIDEINLAREWQGDRPTVIMLDSFDDAPIQIDEAMKILAPGGRLVVSVLQHSANLSENFWRAIQRKYKMSSFVANEQGGFLSKDTTFIVIDKTPNPVKKYQEPAKNFIPTNPTLGIVDTEAMFAEVQRQRVTRLPVLAENAAIQYEGATEAEQTIFTPLDNPYRPQQFRGESDIEQPLPFTEPEPQSTIWAKLIGLGDSNTPGVNVVDDSMGSSRRVVSDTPSLGDTPPPDNTPIGVSRRVGQWVREKFQDTNLKWYAISPQTAKVTLEKLGTTGQSLGESLKRIRNVGDRMFGRGTSKLDRLFPQARDYIQQYADANNIPLHDAIESFNQILVRHHEGRSEGAVPQIIDDITEEMKDFITEHISNPMLKMNLDIMRQGLLFEMPESLVQEGLLDNEARAELEADPPNFEKFMRRRLGRDEYGLVQGFVREVSTGKVFAVRVKGDVYADPKTESARIAQKSVKYTLESPFGERIEGDSTILYDANDRFTLIAARNPASRRWTGNRNEAKEAWDAEIQNNPRPDVLAQHFADNGINLPEGTRFVYRKVANLGEWSVRHEGKELYRIRQILPVSVNRRTKQVTESHSAYDPFKGRLLVYDANQVRTPIFIFRGATAHKLWSPIENYYPHLIDFHNMNPDPTGGKKYERFLSYLQQFADANEMEFDAARAILTQYIAESKTRKYGHLEQERQYNFPAFNRNYFQVWEQYIARAGHRMQTIREFGQQNDLLTAQLNEFISEDTLTDPLTDAERATLRLRFLSGYQDFTPLNKKAWSQPFRDDNGNPTELNPNEGEYVGMGPGDWQALVDAGVLSVLQNGNFRATDAGIALLENPSFLHGAMLKGMRKMSIASDIIKNQLGWRQGDLFDEEMGDMVRGVQGWTGVLFLGRAWAANIAQSVNTGIALDGKSLLQGFRKLMQDPKHREWMQEIGALAIDVMHDYGSGSALGTRVLRQQLGAIPRYQMGRTGWRSFVPSEENIDDFGVKMQAWTPFYAVERMNRSIAALASRAYAVGNMKQMIRDPKRAKVARERLLSLPGAYELQGKLDAAMGVQGLTQKDIETVSEMLPDEVKEHAPHLWAVHDFLAEFAKETADWTQHRVEAMDRGRPWTRNPIFIMMQQLQSFNIAQTKFVKDTFKREWKIMHTYLNESDLPSALQKKGVARALGSLWLIPRIIMWGGLFGIPTAVLGKIIRFDTPDEDTIGLATGLYKAGMFTQLGEYMLQINRWNRGAEEIILGPTLGTVADVAGDVGQGKPFRTVSRLARPPLGGPSMKQLIEWTEPPKSSGRRSSGGNRNTRRNQSSRRGESRRE